MRVAHQKQKQEMWARFKFGWYATSRSFSHAPLGHFSVAPAVQLCKGSSVLSSVLSAWSPQAHQNGHPSISFVFWIRGQSHKKHWYDGWWTKTPDVSQLCLWGRDDHRFSQTLWPCLTLPAEIKIDGLYFSSALSLRVWQVKVTPTGNLQDKMKLNSLTWLLFLLVLHNLILQWKTSEVWCC